MEHEPDRMPSTELQPLLEQLEEQADETNVVVFDVIVGFLLAAAQLFGDKKHHSSIMWT